MNNNGTFADDEPFYTPNEESPYAEGGESEGADDAAKAKKAQQSQTSKLEALLTGQVQQVAENRVMTQLLADPNFRAVLEAQRAGKKVKIIPLSEDGSDEQDLVSSGNNQAPTQTKVDLDSMSNAELTQYIIKNAAKAAPKVEENPEVRQLKQQVEMLTQHIQSENRKKVDGEVAKVQAKYPDFDNHKQTMLELSQQNPGLQVEELYILAKRRAGEPITAAQEVATERPTSSAARPSNIPKPRGPVVGVGAWNQYLQEVLSKKNFNVQQEI
jgi:hypothetical protein